MMPNDAEALIHEFTGEVKNLIFTGELQNDMKLGYFCFMKYFCQPDVVLLFCYTVLNVFQPDSHSCPEKMLTHPAVSSQPLTFLK